MADASITAAVILWTALVAPNTVQVASEFTDNMGVKHVEVYIAPSSFDTSAELTRRRAAYAALLNADEIATNIAGVEDNGSLFAPTFRYSTALENAAALRVAYRDATKKEAMMIGDYLNTLPSATLQNIFGISAAQAAALQTNYLQPAAALATSFRAAAGQ